jgi:PTS system mannose-specific IIC component
VTALPAILLLLLWGTIAGLDLVSVPQALLSRPIVAASVAGLIVGNVAAGLLAGMALELYALDVLPIGASRYPDYSVAAVAGGVAAAMAPAPVAVALAGIVGLPMAVLGGWSLQKLRRRNAVSVQRRLERVAAGEGRAIWELQRNGMMRDALRSFTLAVIGILLAWLLTRIDWRRIVHAEWLSWAMLAGGIAAAFGGGLRSAGQGARRRWLAVGLATGILVELVR